MAKSPEEVLQTAYEDGYQIALERGLTKVGEVTSPFEVTYSLNPAEQHYSWLTQIDQGSIFINGRNIVGLVLGRERWKAYVELPTPCLMYSAVPSVPSTQEALILLDNLPRLVTKQPLENVYGSWFEISVHPVRNDLSFTGSSAADIIGLTRGRNPDWLFENHGREVLRTIVEDSFDLLARYHRLIEKILNISPV